MCVLKSVLVYFKILKRNHPEMKCISNYILDATRLCRQIQFVLQTDKFFLFYNEYIIKDVCSFL